MPGAARVTVESIAAGGDGVARAGGLAVFVPRTAPGDVAEVRIRTHGRFGRGELLRLVSGSAERVEPRCRHYGGDRCGGCQLQHLAYPAQLEAKRRIVRDALVRLGRREVALPPITGSPAPWGYRAKLTLAMRFDGGHWRFGLHAFDEPGVVFDLQECQITAPDVLAAWSAVREAAAWLPAAPELRGAVRRLDDGLSFTLDGGDAWPGAARFAGACPALSLIRWRPAHGAPRVIVDRRAAPQPVASFTQVNTPMAGALHAAIVARALLGDPRLVVDAYAGAGDTAAALAARGVRVTAVESDPDAVRAAAVRLAPPSRVVAGRVEDSLERLLPADLVILNPPRAGVHEQVTASLTRRPVARVLYVSCDPATLARDLRRLPGYALTHLALYDMFPQTAHVETLCELVAEDT